MIIHSGQAFQQAREGALLHTEPLRRSGKFSVFGVEKGQTQSRFRHENSARFYRTHRDLDGIHQETALDLVCPVSHRVGWGVPHFGHPLLIFNLSVRWIIDLFHGAIYDPFPNTPRVLLETILIFVLMLLALIVPTKSFLKSGKGPEPATVP
jgi:hypothetical protein